MRISKFISHFTLVLFFVSLASGAVILFAYHPSKAYESLQKIVYILPYGNFFRSLHYFSSELFIIFLILHIILELSKKDISISKSSWNYSVLGFFIVITLMFSGFVLKGDKSGLAAGNVAFNLIEKTPVLEYLLPLFKDNTIFLHKFFIWHVLYLPAILSYAIFKHIKRFSVKTEFFAISIAFSLLVSFLFKMPSDIAPNVEVNSLRGPWFFWGAENLLQLGLSSLEVNFILSALFLLLLCLPVVRYKKSVKFLLLLWLILYFLVSLR